MSAMQTLSIAYTCIMKSVLL